MIIPYLVFPGNCKEAMSFYAKVLNGKLVTMQTFAEAPMPVDDAFKSRIFNSEVQAGSIRIKASDDLPGHDVVTGSHISMYTVFPDKKSKEMAFQGLAEEGNILFPLDDNFGMLKDKFGMQWMMIHEAG